MIRALQRRIRKATFFTRVTRYPRALEVPLPTHIQVEPTTRCNATCGTCSRGSLAKDQLHNDLKPAALERILDCFPDLKSIRLLGLGEPFLAPEFETILEILKRRRIQVWLISNGSLLGKTRVRDLVHGYVYDLGVSIDSAEPDEFRELRPMGSIGLEEVLAGTRALIAERNAGRSNAIIGVNSAISHTNLHSLDAIGDLCIELKVDYLAVVAVENWLIRGDPGYEPSAGFVAESMKQAHAITRRVSRLRRRLLLHGILVGYKTPKRRLGRCHWPFSSLHVSPNGTVTPCCIRTQADRHGVFNLFADKPFEAHWNGEAYKELRRDHLTGDVSNPICGNCPM
ncbi:MAG: radical SAM/SPASM domain-containing protein [Myxococcota bacterium]